MLYTYKRGERRSISGESQGKGGGRQRKAGNHVDEVLIFHSQLGWGLSQVNHLSVDEEAQMR